MEIDFTYEKYKVHKVPMLLENKEQLRKDLLEYVGFFRPGHLDNKQHLKNLGLDANKKIGGPGIQIQLGFSDAESIRGLDKHFGQKVLEYHNKLQPRKAVQTFTHSWVFISTPQNKDSNYHNHISFHPSEPMSADYTWTYYLDVPDNCVGDEGKLFFSPTSSDEDAMKIFPEIDSLYIFPGTLWHKPQLNPNSTNWRIVLAGNTKLKFKDKVLI